MTEEKTILRDASDAIVVYADWKGPDGKTRRTYLNTTPAPKSYAFEPQPDITTYELARCIRYVIARDGRGLENEPESVRRHWREVTA